MKYHVHLTSSRHQLFVEADGFISDPQAVMLFRGAGSRRWELMIPWHSLVSLERLSDDYAAVTEQHEIRYPTIGFTHVGESGGGRGWCFEFHCGVCGWLMNVLQDQLHHSHGRREPCAQYEVVFRPVVSNGAVCLIVVENSKANTETTRGF